MSNIAIPEGHVKHIVCPEILTLQAFDGTGNFASVEVNFTSRWRHGHGVETFSQLVEIALDNGVRYYQPENLGDGSSVPGCYGLKLSPFDIIALSDPCRPTFLSINGLVVQVRNEGGTA